MEIQSAPVEIGSQVYKIEIKAAEMRVETVEKCSE
jgi:hypothetical protein